MSYEKLNGTKHLGDKSKKIVHDLKHETRDCLIVEIIHGHRDVFFDNLEQAHQDGYHNCHYCILIK